VEERPPAYRPPYRPKPDPGPEPPAPPRPKRRSRHLLDLVLSRGWIVGVLGALVLVLIVVTAAFAVVNNNSFCGRCHVIKKEVVSFNASSHHHPGVGCQNCHTKPGVFNYFIRNLQSATHIVEYISGRYQRPIVTYIGVENCVTCHPKSQIERDIVVGNIRVNHTGLREAGYQCMTCHSQVVHGNVTPVGSRGPESTMHICWRCHNGVTLSQRCTVCHINGVPQGTANVRIPVHMTVGNCTTCHRPQFCARCHNGLAMPHPAGWLQTHGPIVLQRGARICVTCHTKKDPTFCIRCHGLPMPHPADWLATHPAKATSDPALCVRCHGQDSCVRCHGVVLPHPASFIASHWVAAVQNGGVCVKCHGNTAGGGAASCYGGQCHHPSPSGALPTGRP
jgi:hypothetical protein